MGAPGTGEVGTATAATPCFNPTDDVVNPAIDSTESQNNHNDLPPELRAGAGEIECPAIVTSDTSAGLVEDSKYVNVAVVGGVDGIGDTDVTVRVTTEDGQPVENAQVYVNGEHRGHTSGDGTVTVEHSGSDSLINVRHGDASGEVFIDPEVAGSRR